MRKMVAVVYDAEWFNVNQGLRHEGLCLEYLSDAHAIVNEICSYFRPKLNKNGWKYEEYVEPIVATKIKKLWLRVYSQEDVTNKQLSFKFARGLVAEYKGFKVNWAEHAASARTLRKNVKIKKATNEEKKMHFEEVLTRKGPSTLKTSGNVLSSGLEGSVSFDSLKVRKVEGSCKYRGAPLDRNNKGRALSNPSFSISPHWSAAELENMKFVVSSKESLLGER